MNVVEVVTGARLHFGLICGGRTSGCRFGGIGLMLRNPCWVISASQSSDSSCTAATAEVRQRIERLLPALCRRNGVTGLRVAVRDAIPLHRGLGAGTQLTLALASAAQVAAGRPRPPDSLNVAMELNRIRRSAVGTFGFDRGGLIVDDGQPADKSDRRLHKYELPHPWRVVLLTPTDAAGLSGAKEESVFREERHMTESTVQEQTDLIRNVVIPAIQHNDFERFCDAVGQYGRNAGNFFAAQQGGVFSSRVIRQLSETVEFRDLPLVQSSWGPTVAVFAQSQLHADDLVARIQHSAFASELNCHAAEPLNYGATVRTVAPEISDHVVRG